MSFDAQDTTRQETLRLLLLQGSCTASTLAAHMEISVQAMRRHLRSLEKEGFIQFSANPIGPGRPSNKWTLTNKGQNCFDNGNRSQKFALDLLDSIEESDCTENLSEILQSQMLKKSVIYRQKIGQGSLKSRLKKLVELRKKEGYSSELNISKNGSSWYLNAFDCSISTIAEKYPVVCDQELDLLRNVFPDCVIQRIHWRFDDKHSCGFEISQIMKDV